MKNLLEIISKPDNVAIVMMMILVCFFTCLAFYYAITGDRRREKEAVEGISPVTTAEIEDKVSTWHYLVRKEFLMTIAVIIGLSVWSIVLNAPMEQLANPTLTPNPAKAPWYFLGLQEMLVYFDPWIAGVVLPSLIIVGLCVIPYVDINPKGNGYYTWKERKFAISTFGFGFLVLWIVLIVIGVFMRGPGWLFYWPWQEWDLHGVAVETNVDFSQLIGIDSRTLAGSIIGGVVVMGYLALGTVLPYLYLTKRKSKALSELGLIRFLIVSHLFALMLALPIKIVLRLLFNIKYIWVTPWFNI